MKRRQVLESFLAMPIATVSGVSSAGAAPPDEPAAYPRLQPQARGDEARRILWAGSSSTYYHALPLQVATWLAQAGTPCFSHMVGRSGTACYKYLVDGFACEYGVEAPQTVKDLISEGHFHDLVLQIPLDHLAGEGDNDTAAFLAGIETYCELAAAKKTRVWLYEQGWKDSPAMTRGRALLAKASRRHRARIVPCATAWRRVRRAKPELELHDLPDRTHPGQVGTYLNLSLFLAAFTGHPVRGWPTRSIFYWPFLMQGEAPGERRRDRRNAYLELNEPLAAYLQDVATGTARAAGLF